MDPITKEIFSNVKDGDVNAVKANVQSAIDSGVPAVEILNEGMVAAMAEVGRLFGEGECFVPEMLIAARAMQSGMGLLKPHLKSAEVKSAGRVAVGTVKGDLHDIGKNLVAMMLEGAGFEIIDLGTDVPPEKFVQAVREQGAQIVVMSALLTTTMPSIKTTIDALTAAGLREQVKVMIGGAPVTQNFANQIGADGFAPDASRAVAAAQELISRRGG
jgi:5-methyltetrahydrofolate--homocysteine methyltransferase